MGIIKKGESGKRSITAYYDQLKKDAWSGTARTKYAPYLGPTGQRKHLTQATKLGGLYILGQFRGKESRLFTAAKYAVAPIRNTTTLGKIARTATNALRSAQQLGVIGSELTNSYPDIKITKNPLRRLKSVLNRNTLNPNEVRKKYGLQYDNQETSYHPSLGNADVLGSGVRGIGRGHDMIPVRFKTNDMVIPVRGIITGLTDTVSPTWNETSYVGRPQSVVSYGGFARDLSFDLTLAAINPHQLRPMWAKINDLSKLVLPQADGGETRFAGRLCEVTIGSYMQAELCAVNSFVITPNEDAYWEVGVPEVDHPSLTLERSPGNKLREKMITLKEIAAAQVYDPRTNRRIVPTPRGVRSLYKATGKFEEFKMPRVCTISFGLKVLHNAIPGTDGGKQLFTIPEGPDVLARRFSVQWMLMKATGQA